MKWPALLSMLAVGEPVPDEEKSLISRVCSRDDPVGGCPERMEAQSAGTFYADFDLWGYVSSDIPLRYMSDQAFEEVYIHRREYRHENKTRSPYLWSCCPWCGEELPSLGLLRKYREKMFLGLKP